MDDTLKWAISLPSTVLTVLLQPSWWNVSIPNTSLLDN